MAGSPSVAVIGAGMAGLAAADRLAGAGVAVEIFEAEREWGGHTRSCERDGFLFDEGPHVSFTKDEAVRDLFTRGAGEIVEFPAAISNYFRTRWVKHPAQCHLHGLDPDLVTACITDFVRAQAAPPKVENYEDWCVAMFGRTFADNFPRAYTRKYWTLEAAQMSTDWVAARMYPPKLEEVVRGALVPDQGGEFHYLSRFRYPARGGFQSFMRGMLRPELLRLGKRLARLRLAGKELQFEDGSSRHYEHIICTMPLPELIRAIEPSEVPSAVRAASEELLCSSLVLIDVAVERPDLAAHHWFYVYDEDISFARGHFPHMLSAHNAPAGRGSIQLEVYHSRHKPLETSAELLPERVVDELVKTGVLRRKQEVLWAQSRQVRYANVIFDHHRSAALGVIQPWLAGRGVLCAGRYGDWAYHWTDDAVRSGWRAADQLLAGFATGASPRS
jgi:protoporphyrinogen oxidase